MFMTHNILKLHETTWDDSETKLGANDNEEKQRFERQ